LAGVKSDQIHGNKSQNARQNALNAFKRGEVKVLVATDVAARGIDVSDVTHVINYQVPMTFDSYIHRIGRTGRAGKTGKALTFV
ncbi:MAG: C-terminal helicase domain-containing protein, partial [Salibacteraceae bacterium]|nr:C-terminal helicase domain-containing protein [Salibacteraceae bacterium]